MQSSDQLSATDPAARATVVTEDDLEAQWSRVVKRRSFLKGMTIAGAAAVPGSALLASGAAASTSRLADGDAAILRFLAAAELIESDLWAQYTELGGVNINGASDGESPGVPAGGFNRPYVAALENIDGDMPQYITDNTDDECSHAAFLNAYLRADGSREVDLDEFRRLPSSTATGAQQIGRLTNLMNLNVDTSWYTRYRSTPTVIAYHKVVQAVFGFAGGHASVSSASRRAPCGAVRSPHRCHSHLRVRGRSFGQRVASRGCDRSWRGAG